MTDTKEFPVTKAIQCVARVEIRCHEEGSKVVIISVGKSRGGDRQGTSLTVSVACARGGSLSGGRLARSNFSCLCACHTKAVEARNLDRFAFETKEEISFSLSLSHTHTQTE